MTQTLRTLARAAHAVSQRFSRVRKADASDLTRIRAAMLERVIDCEIKTTRRVRLQLESASSALQLWLLRSEVYQAVSEKFGQAEATKRVASLAPLFRGLLPEKQLRAV